MSQIAKKYILENARQIKAYLSQTELDQDMLNHINQLAGGIIILAETCRTPRRKKRQPAVAV